ncbi:vanadium-dependent haloperoxidase [Methylomonas koyamae]|uniref:vanadium-dependent haloperoxidase n=1 Tax=Methylomonas koyamae TaxID=702114 RepID=UPI0011281FB3|nr:vanadium-dependent haloperoxidase [Methylomonas koyamae]
MHSNTTQFSKGQIGILAGAILLALSSPARAAVPGVDPSENVLLQWNDAVLEAIRETHPGPPMVARMLAVLNTSTFDAWAAFDNKARGTRFGPSLKAPASILNDAGKKEAIAYAAFRAASDLFPQSTQQQYFKDLLTQQGYDPNNATTNKNTAAGIGNVAAGAVLTYRHQDKSNQLGNINGGAPYSDWTGYQPVNTPDQINDPNRWQPLRVSDGHGGTVVQKFIAPHWGRVLPFGIKDWDKDVVTPVRKEIKKRTGRVGPATVDQPEYREQALQVIAYSASLTDQQKVIAEFWADGPSSELPPGHWNLFAQSVSHRDNHNLDQDVKMLFAMSNTVFDTSIAIWGAKVKFDSVRPVTAIHYLFGGHTINAWAGPYQGTQSIDGQSWEPYQASTVVTPPFAEYPSGHSAFSSAAAEALKRFTGSDVFGDTYTQSAGVSRVEPGQVPAADISLSWATFSDAADEAAISRRYGGIHFVDGDVDSRQMGRRVAKLDWPVIQYYFGNSNSKEWHEDEHDHDD